MISKINEVKKDKEKLVTELEREEEFLTNTLQRQLSVIRREKEQTEAEVVGLKKQLEDAGKERERVSTILHFAITLN